MCSKCVCLCAALMRACMLARVHSDVCAPRGSGSGSSGSGDTSSGSGDGSDSGSGTASAGTGSGTSSVTGTAKGSGGGSESGSGGSGVASGSGDARTLSPSSSELISTTDSLAIPSPAILNLDCAAMQQQTIAITFVFTMFILLLGELVLCYIACKLRLCGCGAWGAAAFGSGSWGREDTSTQTDDAFFDNDDDDETNKKKKHQSKTSVVPKSKAKAKRLLGRTRSVMDRAMNHNKVVQAQDSHYQTRDALLKRSEQNRKASKGRLERRRLQLAGKHKKEDGVKHSKHELGVQKNIPPAPPSKQRLGTSVMSMAKMRLKLQQARVDIDHQRLEKKNKTNKMVVEDEEDDDDISFFADD